MGIKRSPERGINASKEKRKAPGGNMGLFFSESTVKVAQNTHYARSLDFHGSAAVWGR